MSSIHLARQGFITKSALPNVTRQRGTTTAQANLMLYGAGKTTVSNNTTFIDSSTNAFTVTRNGDTVQSGFNPFSGVSNGAGFFDGNGDYLSIPDNTALNMGTSSFTIECFIYLSSAPGIFATIINKDGKNAVSWPQYALYVNNNYRVNFSLSSVPNTGGVPTVLITGATTLALNTWYHVAATRVGTSATLWVNGISDGTSSSVPSTLNNGARPLLVGWEDRTSPDTAFNFPGYITNLRVLKGTALYTSNFTPPTSPLTAITNTSLLLLMENYSVVNSTSTNFPVSIFGNTAISTAQAPTGMSSSIFFDGTGDYLTMPSNAVFSYPAEFTVEMWIYPLTQLTISGGSTTVLFFVDGTNGLQVGAQSATLWGIANRSAGWRLTTSTLPTLNTWNHIAITRNSSNNTSIFLNGTRVANGTVTDSFGAGSPYVGFATAFALAYNGYLSNLRVAKGTAVYDPTLTTLTVPTAPLSVTVSVPNFVTNSTYGVYQLA